MNPFNDRDWCLAGNPFSRVDRRERVAHERPLEGPESAPDREWLMRAPMYNKSNAVWFRGLPKIQDHTDHLGDALGYALPPVTPREQAPKFARGGFISRAIGGIGGAVAIALTDAHVPCMDCGASVELRMVAGHVPESLRVRCCACAYRACVADARATPRA